MFLHAHWRGDAVWRSEGALLGEWQTWELAILKSVADYELEICAGQTACLVQYSLHKNFIELSWVLLMGREKSGLFFKSQNILFNIFDAAF